MRMSILFTLLATSLFCQEPKTPQEIQMNLDRAEQDFKKAQEMFNPWYTGPLITPSASVMDVGTFSLQPYLYVTDTYASFDSKRHSHKLSDGSLVTVNPIMGPLLQFGLTPYTDFTITNVQAVMNWQDGSFGGGYGDTSTTLGFLFLKQTANLPGIKFAIKETFPTGSYQHLSSNGLGLSATGTGSYITTFSFSVAKVIFFSKAHPVDVRLFLSYALPTSVHVKGFNAYGGGHGADATVSPGNIFDADFGLEYSITQRWVLSLDLAYEAQGEITYTGKPGTNHDGTPASIGKGYRDSLSLAPAVEYNWSENLGVVGGFWFSIYGRNSSNFFSGIFSVTYTWQVN